MFTTVYSTSIYEEEKRERERERRVLLSNIHIDSLLKCKNVFYPFQKLKLPENCKIVVSHFNVLCNSNKHFGITISNVVTLAFRSLTNNNSS